MINGERAKRRTVQDNLVQLAAVPKITLPFLKKFIGIWISCAHDYTSA